jgi:acyl-CoA thioesterase FadM
MYPVIRLTHEWIRCRNAEPLPIDGTHVTPMRCMPWDLDMWMELNNGRTLTLYDVGRLALGKRIGLVDALRRRGWSMTMAGASVRFRQRVRMFDKFDVRTASVGRDERFIYIEQSMWRDGKATSSVLYRTAVTDANGIVPTQLVVEELGRPDWNPRLPQWVEEWVRAESHRPWPPITGEDVAQSAA